MRTFRSYAAYGEPVVFKAGLLLIEPLNVLIGDRYYLGNGESCRARYCNKKGVDPVAVPRVQAHGRVLIALAVSVVYEVFCFLGELVVKLHICEKAFRGGAELSSVTRKYLRVLPRVCKLLFKSFIRGVDIVYVPLIFGRYLASFSELFLFHSSFLLWLFSSVSRPQARRTG